MHPDWTAHVSVFFFQDAFSIGSFLTKSRFSRIDDVGLCCVTVSYILFAGHFLLRKPWVSNCHCCSVRFIFLTACFVSLGREAPSLQMYRIDCLLLSSSLDEESVRGPSSLLLAAAGVGLLFALAVFNVSLIMNERSPFHGR